MKLEPPSIAERAKAATHLYELIEYYGSRAAVSVATRVSWGELDRVRIGAAGRHAVDALRTAHASLRRCVGCGDVLHVKWTDGRCAPCEAAVIVEADAAEVAGSIKQWAARRVA